MSGRYRAVALQAVGVAVLAAIVYLAFLRPGEPGPLSGITGPDAGQQASQEPHSGRKTNGKTKSKGGSNENRRPRKQNSGGGASANDSSSPGSGEPGSTAGPSLPPGVAGPPSPVGPSPSSPGTSGGTEPIDPQTPPGEQYQDTVARIIGKLDE